MRSGEQEVSKREELVEHLEFAAGLFRGQALDPAASTHAFSHQRSKPSFVGQVTTDLVHDVGNVFRRRQQLIKVLRRLLRVNADLVSRDACLALKRPQLIALRCELGSRACGGRFARRLKTRGRLAKRVELLRYVEPCIVERTQRVVVLAHKVCRAARVDNIVAHDFAAEAVDDAVTHGILGKFVFAKGRQEAYGVVFAFENRLDDALRCEDLHAGRAFALQVCYPASAETLNDLLAVSRARRLVELGGVRVLGAFFDRALGGRLELHQVATRRVSGRIGVTRQRRQVLVQRLDERVGLFERDHRRANLRLDHRALAAQSRHTVGRLRLLDELGLVKRDDVGRVRRLLRVERSARLAGQLTCSGLDTLKAKRIWRGSKRLLVRRTHDFVLDALDFLRATLGDGATNVALACTRQAAGQLSLGDARSLGGLFVLREQGVSARRLGGVDVAAQRVDAAAGDGELVCTALLQRGVAGQVQVFDNGVGVARGA